MRARDFLTLSLVGVGISSILAPQPVGLGRWGYKLNLYTNLSLKSLTFFMPDLPLGFGLLR